MSSRAAHLLDSVMAGCKGATHSMADLVVCHQGLGLAIHHRGALHAGHNAVNAVVDLLVAGCCLAAASC